ncbi:MAG TPA: hypothetical protein VGW38_12305, partial [Chloroflexota bacterium]|nr:hypothetical protein [Chloroflexota bacterium]
AAYYVDPGSPSAIAHGILLLLEDSGLATTLRSRGPAQAARFDWRVTARQMVGVYQQAAREHVSLSVQGA